LLAFFASAKNSVEMSLLGLPPDHSEAGIEKQSKCSMPSYCALGDTGGGKEKGREGNALERVQCLQSNRIDSPRCASTVHANAYFHHTNEGLCSLCNVASSA